MAGALAGKPVVDFKIGKGSNPSDGHADGNGNSTWLPVTPTPQPTVHLPPFPTAPPTVPPPPKTNAHVHAQADPDANA